MHSCVHCRRKPTDHIITERIAAFSKPQERWYASSFKGATHSTNIIASTQRTGRERVWNGVWALKTPAKCSHDTVVFLDQWGLFSELFHVISCCIECVCVSIWKEGSPFSHCHLLWRLNSNRAQVSTSGLHQRWVQTSHLSTSSAAITTKTRGLCGLFHSYSASHQNSSTALCPQSRVIWRTFSTMRSIWPCHRFCWSFTSSSQTDRNTDLPNATSLR